MAFRRFSIFSILVSLFLSLTASGTERMNITKERMEKIGDKIANYSVVHGQMPQARSIDELAALLDSTKKSTFPLRDGWGRKFHFTSRKSGASKNSQLPDEYWLGSTGYSGQFDGFLKYILKTDSESENIIYSNGSFVNLPPRKGGVN
jgi:hypothetical protein